MPRPLQRVASAALDDVWRRKLGLLEWATRSNADGGGAALWGRLRELLETGPTDFTIFWRQLAVLAEAAPPAAGGDAAWLEPLRPAFHKELCDGAQSKWAEWLRDWRTELSVCAASGLRGSAVRGWGREGGREGEWVRREESVKMSGEG